MDTPRDDRIEVEVYERDDDDLLPSIRRGLLAEPREISPRFFYDDRGSRLFEQICELPEYYQTRTEEIILHDVVGKLVAETRAEEVIELGSGAAVKTRVLLDALEEAGTLRRYLPFDVSEGIVRRTAAELVARYPKLTVHAVVGDFLAHLDRIPDGYRQLCIFLGGTIGNFGPARAAAFLAELGAQMKPGDCFLMGVDLIKSKTRLEAAYNDSAGVTAEFNRNALRVLNDLLDGNFVPDDFEHVSFYNEDEHQIEMWLRSKRDQTVRLPKLDLELTLAGGEAIRTEISRKFDRDKVERLLASGGFTLARWDTDPEDLFALSLARKR